jgi:hypothetical protein
LFGLSFRFKLGHIATLGSKCHGMHEAPSKVENSAQGSSCQLKFVHGLDQIQIVYRQELHCFCCLRQRKNLVPLAFLNFKCLLVFKCRSGRA